MRATLALFQLSACCMYKTVLSNEYLSVLLTHGDVKCISEIFDKGAEVSIIVSAVSTSKNINAQFISLLVSKES